VILLREAVWGKIFVGSPNRISVNRGEALEAQARRPQKGTKESCHSKSRAHLKLQAFK
jgi:hypothetical protein